MPLLGHRRPQTGGITHSRCPSTSGLVLAYFRRGGLVRFWGCFSVPSNDREMSGFRMSVRARHVKIPGGGGGRIKASRWSESRRGFQEASHGNTGKCQKRHLFDTRPYAGELRVVGNHRLDVPVEFGGESGRRLSLPGLVQHPNVDQLCVFSPLNHVRISHPRVGRPYLQPIHAILGCEGTAHPTWIVSVCTNTKKLHPHLYTKTFPCLRVCPARRHALQVPVSRKMHRRIVSSPHSSDAVMQTCARQCQEFRPWCLVAGG